MVEKCLIGFQGQQARGSLRDKLKQIAQTYLGFMGGLFVTDSGPNLVTDEEWSEGELQVKRLEGLEVRVALLGEVPATRMISMQYHRSAEDFKNLIPAIRLGHVEVQPTLTIRLCLERDALRSLLFGESPSEQRGENVVDGAFRFPPWYLASPGQWSQHLIATKGLRLFDFWGEWKGRFARVQHTRTDSDGLTITNASERRGRYKSRKNLREGNDHRRREKEQELDTLETDVRPVWEKLCRANGKAPGRSLLRQEAEKSGIVITDRQARGIIERLVQQ